MGHFSSFYSTLFPYREDVWIESGTYQGDSIARALGLGFQEIHSIEVCPRLFQALPRLFFQHPSVHLHQGSSPLVLDRLLTEEITSRYTVFWLDAHFQGDKRDEMDPAAGECPLLAELQVILSKQWTAPLLIAIDDLSLFTPDFWETSPYRTWFARSAWPTLETLRSMLQGFCLRETEECLYAWREAPQE